MEAAICSANSVILSSRDCCSFESNTAILSPKQKKWALAHFVQKQQPEVYSTGNEIATTRQNPVLCHWIRGLRIIKALRTAYFLGEQRQPPLLQQNPASPLSSVSRAVRIRNL